MSSHQRQCLRQYKTHNTHSVFRIVATIYRKQRYATTLTPQTPSQFISIVKPLIQSMSERRVFAVGAKLTQHHKQLVPMRLQPHRFLLFQLTQILLTSCITDGFVYLYTQRFPIDLDRLLFVAHVKGGCINNCRV
jgi:hypothetical protein